MGKNEDQLSEYRNMLFVETQFSTHDALVLFVPVGKENDSVITRYSEMCGPSRWYPTEGGHNVYFPYEGEEYDAKRFRIEKGAWNHDHCDACSGTIDESVSCWITKEEPFVLLCEQCHQKL